MKRVRPALTVAVKSQRKELEQEEMRMSQRDAGMRKSGFLQQALGNTRNGPPDTPQRTSLQSSSSNVLATVLDGVEPETNVDALYEHACSLLADDTKGAEATFQRALQLEPTHVKTLSAYAVLLHEQHDHRNAQIMYESALRQAKCSELSPRSLSSAIDTLCNMGRLLKEVNHQTDRAERMYRRALQLDGSHVDALCGYAELLFSERGEAQRALTLLDRALQVDAKHVSSLVARTWIGQTTGTSKHLVEAEYDDILRMFPRNASALCNYGLYMHSVKGNLHAAAAYYRRALAADPKHLNALTNFAALCQLEGQHRQAEEMYLQALEVYPEQVDVLNNYGMLLHTVLGDYDKAEAMYQCALKANPDQVNSF